MAYDITTLTTIGASTMEPFSSGCPLDSRRMEMLHALLPYIPITMQKFLNIYIGFEELMKAIRFIQKGPVIPSGHSQETVKKPDDLLKIMRDFCTPKENEMIDMLLNMNQMMSMYDNYKDMFQMFGGSDTSSTAHEQIYRPQNSPPPPANPFDMLNQMKQFKNTSEIDNLFQDFMN